MYVCVDAHEASYMCIYTYIEREIERERERERLII